MALRGRAEQTNQRRPSRRTVRKTHAAGTPRAAPPLPAAPARSCMRGSVRTTSVRGGAGADCRPVPGSRRLHRSGSSGRGSGSARRQRASSPTSSLRPAAARRSSPPPPEVVRPAARPPRGAAAAILCGARRRR